MVKMIHVVMSSLALALLMGGCSSKTPPKSLYQPNAKNLLTVGDLTLYQAPTSINPTENNFNLHGIDNDNNGIRDDVDIYLTKTLNLDDKQSYILDSLAKTYQKIIDEPVSTKLRDDYQKYIQCYGRYYKDPELIFKLESVYFNNFERNRKLINFRIFAKSEDKNSSTISE